VDPWDLLGRANNLDVPGATDEEIEHAQRALGVELPLDHRTFLRNVNGFEGWFNGAFLCLFGTARLVEMSTIEQRDYHPGLIQIGSDGSREIVGYRLGGPDPGIYLLDITSDGWDDAVFQAPDLTGFVDQMQEIGFRWGAGQ
jgi:hypothetical protein